MMIEMLIQLELPNSAANGPLGRIAPGFADYNTIYGVYFNH